MAEAVAGAEDPRLRALAAIREVLALFAAEPGMARVAAREIGAVGRVGMERYEWTQSRLAAIIDGDAGVVQGRTSGAGIGRVAVGATMAAVAAELGEGRERELGHLLPQLEPLLALAG